MEIIYLIINTAVVGAIGAMLKVYDARNERRGKARDEFNALILHGFEAVGKVAILSAYQLKGLEVNGQLDKAILAYEDFEKEVNRFKKRSAQEAVRL